MRTVEAAGAQLAVREWGGPGGEPLVFWHSLGAASSGELLAEIAPELVERGFHPIALDAPGFGASPALPAERYAVEPTAELLLALLDELAIGAAVLMGHSWGGSVVVHAAARAPERVRALVLLDSGHVDYGDLEGVDAERPLETWVADARERPSRWPSWEAFVDELRAGSLGWSDAIEAALRSAVREEADGAVASITSAETRGAVFYHLARACQSEAWPAIAAAEIPTLVLLATEPAETAAEHAPHVERFRAAVPRAEVVYVPDAGHSLLIDAGPAVARIVGDWLERMRLR